MTMVSEHAASTLIVLCAFISMGFGAIQLMFVRAVRVYDPKSPSTPLSNDIDEAKAYKLHTIYDAISEGAKAFLRAEYGICCLFVAVFSIVILLLVSIGQGSWVEGMLTTLSFIIGAFTSILSGYIGMRVAVFSNVRTTVAASRSGWTECFNVAFRGGAVMGFVLCGIGILMLYAALMLYRQYYDDPSDWSTLMNCITGYGLGGSSVAMFGRVGGGIYTKAADVGADLVGKVVHGIPEDDPRNPATIADNVGDNVGDVAGMGADLFGSFAESTCAALVIASTSEDLIEAGWAAVVFPVAISCVGVLVCLVTSFVATNLWPVRKETDVELVLKMQLVITTVLMIPAAAGVTYKFLPEEFTLTGVSGDTEATRGYAFISVISGAIGGLIIGLVTEYYTSHSYAPVREVADACKTGAATNIIYGLALGYKSTIIPVFVLAIVTYICFALCDLFGVALAAIGMLSTLATGLAVDVFGPISDNAGGIAEMAELPPMVREKTDALDAAGNTTAAIGKGFAIGSASLVSLALYGAFVVRLANSEGFSTDVNVLEPLTFAFLLIGAMIPYWFSAMTMKSVGLAAAQMVDEVSRQFNEKPELLNPDTEERPDYQRCIDISTKASLKEMVPPGALVMLAPLVVGTLFGVQAVYGLLTGAIMSSVQMAISMSNMGGAWDNAKKYIEKQPAGSALGGKKSEPHKAAVVGDTVGDPCKDTSGPALNIVMKLSAVLSLVFAEYFASINGGHGLFNAH